MVNANPDPNLDSDPNPDSDPDYDSDPNSEAIKLMLMAKGGSVGCSRGET